MDTEHWASYYRSGALVSCPTNPEPYYTMEVREAWARFFSALIDGDRILDIGTGNGPVALIAKETATENGCDIRIDAVDRADIDPHRHVPNGEKLLQGIRFHGGVSAEALPFRDRQFNAVSGQYILEYTEIDETLAECARVLKPGGSCQFILHHSDSIIVSNARQSLRQAEFIDHCETLEKLERYCAAAESDAADRDTAREAIYKVGELLQVRSRKSDNPILIKFVIDSVSNILATRSRMTGDELSQRIASLRKELDRWVRRLKDMVSVAMSDKEMDALVNTAEACGFFAVVTGEQFQGGENLIGWRMTMFRGT